ncbi:MAG: hypothetical protein K8U03_09440 [Planctomycetia bacterium]|nr:hypothetical protein [Planctomycetia bacterium]
MQARSVWRWVSRVGLIVVGFGGLPSSSSAQNPFAPTPPAGAAPATTPPTTPPTTTAPPTTPPADTTTPSATPPAATPPVVAPPVITPPTATPPAPANPFAPSTPAAAPAVPRAVPGATPPAAGAAPSANPFAPSTPAAAPAVPSAAPSANPFAPSTPAAAPAVPGKPPPAAGANPFAPTTPAAPAMPATPGTTPAPTTTPATPPAANPFGTSVPATPIPGAPLVGPQAVPTQDTVPQGGFRVLAPGVLTMIPSPVGVDDTRSEHDLIELLASAPNYGERPNSPNRKPARGVRFEHDVWGLEFAFKPIRYIRLPGADGKERLVWYMVFRVKNGPVKRYVHDETQPNKLRGDLVDKPFLFVPRFELESHDVKKLYVDKVIPEAVAAIQKREDKNRKLLTTAELTGDIPPSTPEIDRSIWGVATWEGIDLNTDRFTIFVHGLTNAYKWVDAADGFKAGDPIGKGRSYQYQVLKLNFWRPGDTKYEHEEEIRFGIPGDVDYAWFYK